MSGTDSDGVLVVCMCAGSLAGTDVGRNTQRTHKHGAALDPGFHIPFLRSKQPVPQCLICHTATWLVRLAIIGSAVIRGGWGGAASLKSNSRDNGHNTPQITDNVSLPLRPRISTGLWPFTPAVNRHQLSTAHPLWCA